jgi:hypothetical protein
MKTNRAEFNRQESLSLSQTNLNGAVDIENMRLRIRIVKKKNETVQMEGRLFIDRCKNQFSPICKFISCIVKKLSTRLVSLKEKPTSHFING